MEYPKRARVVCERLAAGHSLDDICETQDMPKVQTVHRWLRLSPDFRQDFDRARRLHAARLVEQVVGIADQLPEGAAEAAVRRGRLRIDARKWAATKLLEDGLDLAQTVAELEPAARVFHIHAGGPDE